MSCGCSFDGIISKSKSIKKIIETVKKVAKTDVSVLITGESGTGKELVARSIHLNSGRPGPFVGINCAAIPEEILESELFGYVKGAFTGACQTKEGKFQFANNGTIFLDEIAEMSPRLQAKLLRVIQEKTVQKLGSLNEEHISARIIAATNKDLRKEVEAGRFREDLLYRLEVVHLHIPPLRERLEDVPCLIEYFFKKFCQKYSKELKLKQSFIKAALNYDFRGNVRELQNLVERAVILAENDYITAKDLPNYVREKIPIECLLDDDEAEEQSLDKPESDGQLSLLELPDGESLDLTKYVQEIERELILRAIRKANGNKSLAAQMLCLNRTTLIEKMKRLCKEAA